ncbi:MAG: hypothetical protein HY747_06525 [Elusimicrobia bacterium]|nr:hypothetical protein [Elusimicrobiota bacterium]
MRPPNNYERAIEWYLTSIDLATQAAITGLRHQHPRFDPWALLALRWRREDEERCRALTRMIRVFKRASSGQQKTS